MLRPYLPRGYAHASRTSLRVGRGAASCAPTYYVSVPSRHHSLEAPCARPLCASPSSSSSPVPAASPVTRPPLATRSPNDSATRSSPSPGSLARRTSGGRSGPPTPPTPAFAPRTASLREERLDPGGARHARLAPRVRARESVLVIGNAPPRPVLPALRRSLGRRAGRHPHPTGAGR